MWVRVILLHRADWTVTLSTMKFKKRTNRKDKERGHSRSMSLAPLLCHGGRRRPHRHQHTAKTTIFKKKDNKKGIVKRSLVAGAHEKGRADWMAVACGDHVLGAPRKGGRAQNYFSAAGTQRRPLEKKGPATTRGTKGDWSPSPIKHDVVSRCGV
jgi:hypothetical protein